MYKLLFALTTLLLTFQSCKEDTSKQKLYPPDFRTYMDLGTDATIAILINKGFYALTNTVDEISGYPLAKYIQSDEGSLVISTTNNEKLKNFRYNFHDGDDFNRMIDFFKYKDANIIRKTNSDGEFIMAQYEGLRYILMSFQGKDKTFYTLTVTNDYKH